MRYGCLLLMHGGGGRRAAASLGGASSFWREEIGNRNRLVNFGGKKSATEIDSSILAGRDRQQKSTRRFGGT